MTLMHLMLTNKMSTDNAEVNEAHQKMTSFRSGKDEVDGIEELVLSSCNELVPLSCNADYPLGSVGHTHVVMTVQRLVRLAHDSMRTAHVAQD